MVAEDFLRAPQVRQWLDGVDPAWTLLTFESLLALRQEPSAFQTAIRIANDLSADEIAGSPVARNTLILLRQAIERGGLPLTATGNLSRAVVAEMRGLIEWPHYDQSDAFPDRDRTERGFRSTDMGADSILRIPDRGDDGGGRQSIAKFRSTDMGVIELVIGNKGGSVIALCDRGEPSERPTNPPIVFCENREISKKKQGGDLSTNGQITERD
jgi:hypothetical protein